MSLTLLTIPQQPITNNKWSAVHMPVIYELQTDLSPNTAGPGSGVSSYNSNNGYLRVDLASIGTVSELEFIKIVAPNAPEYEGVHQVIQKESGDVYTLDIPYTSGTINWSGSDFRKFFSNYYMNVRVYAGLVSSHPLTGDKPIELAAELRLIPDSTGISKFSIHEILKSYVETKNITGDRNNIEFLVQFYISYSESYDVSNGYSLTSFTTGYTTDTFQGNAVNARLRFKNTQGTFLTDYMNNKFLTLFAIPVLFACSEESPNCYQDISFITEKSYANMKLKEEYYSQGVKLLTTTKDIANQGSGVYRVSLTDTECSYDRVDASVVVDGDIDQDSWINSGSGTSWTPSIYGLPTVSLAVFLGSPSPSKFALWPVFVPAGQTADITIQFNQNVPLGSLGGSPTVSGLIALFDASGTQMPESNMTINNDPNGVHTYHYTRSADNDAYFIGIRCTLDYPGTQEGTGSFTILSIASAMSDIPLTEVKTFDIQCGCSNQEMRLTWLNNLGGFDYWNFTAQKTFGVDIMRTEEVQLNKLLIDWSGGDTMRKEVRRDSREYVTVRSQYLTIDQLQALMYIRSSILVQEIKSVSDKRTVIVDNDSFDAYSDGDKLYSLQFRISYTDDIPTQNV